MKGTTMAPLMPAPSRRPLAAARSVLLRALAVVALAGLCTACDDGGGGSPEALQLRLFSPAGSPSPFDGVAWLVVRAEGDGLLEEPFTVAAYEPGGTLSLEGIPYSALGEGRQVAVEGWTDTGAGSLGSVVSRGRSVAVTVPEGGAVQTLDVLFARVNSFVPLTDATDATPGALSQGRFGSVATPTDRGEVVVTGGAVLAAPGDAWWTADGVGAPSTAVDVVTQATGATRALSADEDLFFGRVHHTATALDQGRLVVVGGFGTLSGSVTALKRTEVYQPGQPLQVLANDLAKPRAGHTATLIDPASYTVLFVGGDQDGAATFEIWDPQNGSQGARDLPDGTARSFHAAVPFTVPATGEAAVLIAGGDTGSGMTATSLVYVVAQDQMIQLGTGLSKGARGHVTGTFVPEQGFIYMVGGFTDAARQTPSDAIDVFDVNSQAFYGAEQTSGLFLRTARGGHAATKLDGKAVLIGGGFGSGGAPLDSVEFIYEFTQPGGGAPVIDVVVSCTDPDCPFVPFMDASRGGAAAVTLDSGMALLVGGTSADGSHPAALQLYNPPSL